VGFASRKAEHRNLELFIRDSKYFGIMKILRQFVLILALLLILAPAAWGQTYSLGIANRVEGPAMGTDSVVLAVSPPTAPWTTTADVSWLHLNAANQSGAGSTNVVFSFDANPGATRTGTLTISGQTLTVTQAGAAYVAINSLTTLVPSSYGQNYAQGLAVDTAGNVYIADAVHNAIEKWTATSNTLTTLVSGLNRPYGVAVDSVGNVYFADTYNQAIKEWVAASSNVTTLVSSGLIAPQGVAVDGVGNVYIADTLNNAIKKWTAANSNVTTLVSAGLSHPQGVAVDAAGNVYIADSFNQAIKEWTSANNNVTTLASSALYGFLNVAVDGAGNVYIVLGHAIEEWTVANGNVTTLVSGLNDATSVAVDSAGNVYFADTLTTNSIEELPRAFVDPTAKVEPLTAGSDVLPVVLPTTENLTVPFAPFSDSSWLTVTGISDGVVSFAFTQNNSFSNRTANITLLGQTIPVTQNAIIVTPPILTNVQLTGGRGPLLHRSRTRVFSFAFSNNQGASFTVWTTTNVALPLADWTMAGKPTNNGSGLFQFATPISVNDVERCYRLSSP
jgi:Putative binding domain, N-terminal/NHL repeat